jgi:hypothetical protein
MDSTAPGGGAALPFEEPLVPVVGIVQQQRYRSGHRPSWRRLSPRALGVKRPLSV